MLTHGFSSQYLWIFIRSVIQDNYILKIIYGLLYFEHSEEFGRKEHFGVFAYLQEALLLSVRRRFKETAGKDCLFP
jgi:hypothetical protein